MLNVDVGKCIYIDLANKPVKFVIKSLQCRKDGEYVELFYNDKTVYRKVYDTSNYYFFKEMGTIIRLDEEGIENQYKRYKKALKKQLIDNHNKWIDNKRKELEILFHIKLEILIDKVQGKLEYKKEALSNLFHKIEQEIKYR